MKNLETLLKDYADHVAKRAAKGIPPLPLNAASRSWIEHGPTMTKSFWSLWCKIFCIDLLVLDTVLAEAWSKGISLCNLLGGINGRVSTTCKSDVFFKAELFDDVFID